MKPIGVVCHDAGGAEVVSSFVKAKKLECLFHLEGPALKIFQRKFPNLINSSFEEIQGQCEILYTGTSWGSTLERLAIQEWKILKRKSVAFLEHWVNYLERFELNGSLILPSEIIVLDEYAFQIAQKLFTETPIQFVPNPYLVEIVESAKEKNSQTVPHFDGLYVCEPIKEHALKNFGNEKHWGYTEEDAMNYFFSKACSQFGLKRILIRLHPSEKKGKYNDLIQNSKFSIEVSESTELIDDILNSKMVFGCESMAMVVALQLKKPVVSCIPASGRECVLPHSSIIKLSKMN